MTQFSNQFTQTPEEGYLDLQTGLNNVLAVVHRTGETTPLIPAQAVKIVDSFTPVPAVEALDAVTEVPFGFVVRNMKDAEYPADARLEIARNGSVMHMVASAAIARGAKLQYATATNKVATAVGVNPTIGIALDKAAADGNIIRVLIDIVNINLNDLTDVVIATPTNTQVLRYDGTDARWENAT